MDPSVKFTIKHADGSVCRHKKTWAFYNRKPPQKDEVPGLNGKKSLKYSLRSSKTGSDNNTAVIEINSCLDDTTESENQATTGKLNSMHKESENKQGVNTENAVTTDGADSQNVSVNTENTDDTLDDIGTGVTTENPIVNSQELPVNTENIEKMLDTNDDEAVNAENHLSTDSHIDTEVCEINTEKKVNAEKQVNTENGDKTDWEKLMINSDDSLFEEMTKQMENKQMEDEASESKSKTPTLKSTEDAMDIEGTLPNLTNQANNNDTVTGLLLLGAGINQSMDDIIDKKIDAEINNKELLPVDTPKLPDFARELRKCEKNKGTTGSTPSRSKPSQTQNNPPRKHKRKILPDSESSSTDTPKLPGGRLIITKHKLKKTQVTTTTTRKVRCTVCCMAFDDKDDLKKHHHSDHTNSQCKVCNKSFTTKKSLRKHAYTHLEKQIKCNDCDQRFSFNSELEIHKIKHSTKPSFKCTVIGCNKEYFRKSKLTAYMVNHIGPPIKCSPKGCLYEHTDKRYIKQHMKSHSNKLRYGCRHCDK